MRWIAFGTLALSAFAAGCSTVGPGVMNTLASSGTGYAYSAGRATQNFAFAPTTTQPAVVSALDDLRISSVRQTNDGSAIVFEGKTADNRSASITLRPNPVGTRLSARIGLFGDEALSRAFMDRVGIRLGSLPPSAIPAEPPSTPGSNPYFSRAAVPDAEIFKEQADAPFRASPVP